MSVKYTVKFKYVVQLGSGKRLEARAAAAAANGNCPSSTRPSQKERKLTEEEVSVVKMKMLSRVTGR